MPRVTEEEVEEIIEVDSAILSLDPFITAANLLVTEELYDDSAIDFSESRYKEIERWLAAHFTAIRDMRSAAERAGTVGQEFQYNLGLNLQVTIYGQQALALDTSGTLAALSQGKPKYQSSIEHLDGIG